MQGDKRQIQTFDMGNLIIQTQLFKPGCLCKLPEKRRHFRGGLWLWEGSWGLQTVGRWSGSLQTVRRWSGSLVPACLWVGDQGLSLLWWTNDHWRLKEKTRKQLICATVPPDRQDNSGSYHLIFLLYVRFGGCSNRPWLDFHQGLCFRVCCWSPFLLRSEKEIPTLPLSIWTYYSKFQQQRSWMTYNKVFSIMLTDFFFSTFTAMFNMDSGRTSSFMAGRLQGVLSGGSGQNELSE